MSAVATIPSLVTERLLLRGFTLWAAEEREMELLGAPSRIYAYPPTGHG